MSRGLDTAVLGLGVLSDRDAILDAFFEYASTLFEFSVFFVVKGDVAHGRNVSGLGAPPGLVSRLAMPLRGKGILARAFEHRKAFIAASPDDEDDARLFGSVGRALPHPVVVPLVVRDRVVGIFLGEAPAEARVRTAAGGTPAPLELVRDEMRLWAESVGQVLERLILRRKKVADSAPPPPLPAAASAPVAWPPIPTEPAAVLELPEADRGRSRSPTVIALVAAAIAVVSIVAWSRFRAKPGQDSIHAAGPTLPGWPHAVDPMELVERARKASQLTEKTELGAIEAEVTAAGKVDFDLPAQNPQGIWLRYEFITEDVKSEVIVDGSGMHTGRMEPRERCGEAACRGSVPPPACTYAKLMTAARSAGLGTSEPAFVRYSASTKERAGTPEWLLGVAGRGAIRMNAVTCDPLPRERLRPAALAVKDIPGAPQKVNPLEIIGLARTQSGLPSDAVLLEMDARGVTSAGFVDLSAPDASITFIFAEPLGQSKRRWREVLVRPNGMPIVSDDGDWSPVPARLAGPAIPTPRCTFAGAREHMTRGSVDVGLAHVTYGPDLAFPTIGVWSLEAANLASRRSMNDLECDNAIRRPVQKR
jgi:hypothetical protein